MMLGGLGSYLDIGEVKWGFRGLCDPFISGSSRLEGGGDWFWNVGSDFSSLVRGYRELYC